MPVFCFLYKGSNPPICGIHNAPLVREQVSIDPNVPQLREVTCFRCPVSQAIVNEVKRFYA